jgi:hypothetical protein
MANSVEEWRGQVKCRSKDAKSGNNKGVQAWEDTRRAEIVRKLQPVFLCAETNDPQLRQSKSLEARLRDTNAKDSPFFFDWTKLSMQVEVLHPATH